jgi:endonuclease YncB( thermonuclease family)
MQGRGQWLRPVILSGMLLALITLQTHDLEFLRDVRGRSEVALENGWRKHQPIGPEWFDNGTPGPARRQQPSAAPPSGRYEPANGAATRINCANPRIIDGDTIDCGGQRVRLQGIDAPEMPGHCAPGRTCTPGDPYKSRDFLRSIAGGVVTCVGTDTDSYGRTVARCSSGGRDISCEMIKAGHAVARYAKIDCP